MTKKTTNTKKTTATSKPKSRKAASKKTKKRQDVGSVFAPEGGWKSLLTGETLRFIIGLVLLLIALFAIVAICSLYSSAAHDQSVIEGAAREYHNWADALVEYLRIHLWTTISEYAHFSSPSSSYR